MISTDQLQGLCNEVDGLELEQATFRKCEDSLYVY